MPLCHRNQHIPQEEKKLSGNNPVVNRMQTIILQWEKTANPQAIFLSCYQMMTSNMLTAVERQEFHDPAWVNTFLEHFAGYYFAALEAYEQDPQNAPAVWQMAHNTAREGRVTPLQILLLGINAHINYDLVLTLVDLLEPEWENLSGSRRDSRYADYIHVNNIIARTIDAVQDEILEPSMPAMRIVDQLLGSYDELLVSEVLNHWRETVWQSMLQILEAHTEDEKRNYFQQVETDTIRLGKIICIKG